MEIGEVRLHRRQQQNLLPAPLEESLLCSAFLDCAVDDLAQEHRHRVLVDVVAYTKKGMTRGQVSGSKKGGLGRFCNIRLKDIERKKELMSFSRVHLTDSFLGPSGLKLQDEIDVLTSELT